MLEHYTCILISIIKILSYTVNSVRFWIMVLPVFILWKSQLNHLNSSFEETSVILTLTLIKWLDVIRIFFNDQYIFIGNIL